MAGRDLAILPRLPVEIVYIQWRIQDLSEGQAQSQDWSVNTTSDVIAKRSLEGEALAFLGGSGGMLPRKILKIEMLIYAFSALLGVFLSLNKGSQLLSWIVAKLKSPTVRYGWVGLFYVCENQPMQSRRHYQSALVGFHLANQTAPQHLQEVCYPRASADHSLRHHNFFQLPKANSTLFQSQPLYFASHIFNILPKHIQSSTRLSEFKSGPPLRLF